MFKIIKEIYTNEDFAPTCAVIKLNKNQIARIKKLSQAVRDLDVTYIEEFDCSAILMTGDPKQPKTLKKWDGSTDLDMLTVSVDDFHYKGVFDHSDVSWETKGIHISELS